MVDFLDNRGHKNKQHDHLLHDIRYLAHKDLVGMDVLLQ